MDDEPIPDRIEVGVLMPRHGRLSVWIAPASEEQAMLMTPEEWQALKAEHRRTYPSHGLQWGAWIRQRIIGTLEVAS